LESVTETIVKRGSTASLKVSATEPGACGATRTADGASVTSVA
jgi:hypothetical protein